MTRATLGLALRYGAFAAVAAAANLASQYLCFWLYGGPGAVFAALAVGTGVGLVIKYALDAVWIFDDAGGGARGHARKFSLYTATGVLTTGVFWGAELLAASFSGDTHVRLAAGGCGLILGYLLKFHLDGRFVFRGSAS
ncbi:MAG TPA: GtrA family protein [Alphaproteobacteria bacterium]|jgi:putative flippase GtrA